MSGQSSASAEAVLGTCPVCGRPVYAPEGVACDDCDPPEPDPEPDPLRHSSGLGSLDPLGDRARLEAAEAKRTRRRARNVRNAGGAK